MMVNIEFDKNYTPGVTVDVSMEFTDGADYGFSVVAPAARIKPGGPAQMSWRRCTTWQGTDSENNP